MTDTSAVVTSGVGQPEKAERQDGRTEDKSQEVNTSAEGGGSSASAVEDNRTFNNACSENKQPVKGKGLSVVFPPDSLVLGYMDPPNPWKNAPLCDTGDLLTAYRRGCDINGIKPLTKVLQQIHGIENNKGRFEILSLKGEKIDFRHVESFEELFRRVQFKTLDFEASHLDDESSVALFDMVEYYESTCKLNISFNKNIGVRGWQSCARLIKKTPCLVHLDARNCDLNERVMPIIGRSLKLGSSLTTLHLENTFLSGRALLILVAALKMNEVLQELFLADNKLMPSDAIQLGNLLKFNHSLYLLDLRNNHLQDVGVGHLSDGLYEQNLGKGLNTLVLWNNQITYQGMPALARALGSTESLETLNLGHNNVTNEGIYRLKDGLLKNKSLLRIGLQSTKITCEGAVALAEFIADSRQLLRLDLRENEIKTAGLMALSLALKVNETVTKMDVDKDIKKDSGMKDYADQQKRLQMDITNFLTRNKDLTLQREEEERRQMEERARENTRLREERERQAAVAESSVIETSYIPTCKKISRPSLLFLAECPQQTLDSPGISGTFKFEDWPESLPDNPVTPPVPNQLVSPPPSDLLLSPQYSTRTKARKLFTVCKVGAGGLVSPSIVVQSGLAGSVSGLPDPLPGPSSPVAMLSPTTKQNSSKVRSSITSPTSPINVLSAMQPEFSLPRGEEHLDTTEMAVDNVTTLIHQIVSEAVDMQQKGIDISHGVSAEASDQALQTTIDIVFSEHSDPVLGKVSGTDQPVLLNGFDHSPEDTAGEDVNSKTGVSPANGVVEECKTSETVTSSECRTRSDVTVNNNKAVNSVDSVQRVDGDSSSKDPDLHTNLTLNGMTRELASVLDTLDLSHHQLNNSSNIPLDDATTPDEFERELDAMLASVNGGLPISSVSGSGS